MTEDDIVRIGAELRRQYPGAHIKFSPDRGEIVAEIDPRRAIAVIDRSAPHFHRDTTEIYKVLKGTLYVACGGRGHVLEAGQSLTIEPGTVHFAHGADGPAWIEVLSDPEWTAADNRIL